MPLAMATSGLVFRDSARDRSGSFAESDLNRLPDNARHETDVPFQETKRGKERSQEELIPNKHKYFMEPEDDIKTDCSNNYH